MRGVDRSESGSSLGPDVTRPPFVLAVVFNLSVRIHSEKLEDSPHDRRGIPEELLALEHEHLFAREMLQPPPQLLVVEPARDIRVETIVPPGISLVGAHLLDIVADA